MQVLKQTKEWLSIANEPICLIKEDKIDKIQAIKKLLIEELDETIEGIINEDDDEIYNGIADAYVVLSNLVYYLDLKLSKLYDEFDLVYESNCTKYCKTLEEAELTVKLYKEGKHPNKLGVFIDTYYQETFNKEFPYIVKNSNNKILKSVNFKDVIR